MPACFGKFDCQPLVYQCFAPCQKDERTCWPDLEGEPADGAEERIESENPGLNATLVKYGDSVIKNFDVNRVWIFFNETTKLVVGIPCVG